MREKFQRKQTNSDFRNKCNTKGYKIYNNHSTFVSPIYTFSSEGNINVYTPIQGMNREKYLNHIMSKGKTPTLAGYKYLSHHFFVHRPRLFHLSTEKCKGLIRRKWTSRWLFPRRHDK